MQKNKKFLILLLSLVLLVLPVHGMMRLDSIFTASQEKVSTTEAQMQPYCGYSIIYPIISRWDNFSWLEKRNYQAFFQNMLASYRFNTAAIDGKILLYFSPQYFANQDMIKNIAEQIDIIEHKFASAGLFLNNADISVPYSVILYILPLNISNVIIPLPGELVSDSYKDMSIIVINGNKLNYIKSNPCVLSHAYAHFILSKSKNFDSFWLLESASAWLETEINSKCENLEPFIKYRIRHPEIPLGTNDSSIAAGDANFIKLIEGKSHGIVQRLLSDKESNILMKLNELLIASTNRSLADYYEEYALTNFYSALTTDNISANEISLFPSSNIFTLSQFSASYIKIQSPSYEAVKISLDREKKSLKSWMFIVERSLAFYMSPSSITSNDRMEHMVPFERGWDAYQVIINASMDSTNVSMQFSLLYDYPFKLDSFQASASNRQVVLEWVTLTETDTLGWIIYRKDEKQGGFKKLNELLIPAVGHSIEPTHYVFVDKEVRPRNSYQYYLEAITKSSLPKKGPITSVKLP